MQPQSQRTPPKGGAHPSPTKLSHSRALTSAVLRGLKGSGSQREGSQGATHLDLAGVPDSTPASGDTAAEEADLVQGSLIGDLGDRDGVEHGVLLLTQRAVGHTKGRGAAARRRTLATSRQRAVGSKRGKRTLKVDVPMKW